ncbi:hypothetical protein CVT26_012295 [Gymnopilus dilepis]|uniref:Uncharacterized protein n=1 Tax=Gymnopilus dilepis TaxID=231916 RepID=A0A409YQF3_9AGAR|nr:hypothetical protein CVT26_012295 [Gymnopilus dilepis]
MIASTSNSGSQKAGGLRMNESLGHLPPTNLGNTPRPFPFPPLSNALTSSSTPLTLSSPPSLTSALLEGEVSSGSAVLPCTTTAGLSSAPTVAGGGVLASTPTPSPVPVPVEARASASSSTSSKTSCLTAEMEYPHTPTANAARASPRRAFLTRKGSRARLRPGDIVCYVIRAQSWERVHEEQNWANQSKGRNAGKAEQERARETR